MNARKMANRSNTLSDEEEGENLLQQRDVPLVIEQIKFEENPFLVQQRPESVQGVRRRGTGDFAKKDSNDNVENPVEQEETETGADQVAQ